MADMKTYQTQKTMKKKKMSAHRRRNSYDPNRRRIRSLNNPLPQIHAPDSSKLGTNGDRIVIVMVGLPGRGKTFIGRKIAHYVNFFHGAEVRVFNNGQYRRKYFDAKPSDAKQHANFFAAGNNEGAVLRQLFAQMAIDDLKIFLESEQRYTADQTGLGKYV
jgi:signal recognition particle GTPase